MPGAEWDEQYPELQHKFQLLLFWMDQGSLIFRGNGNDLLNHMQLSVEQFQAAVRLSEPFSRPIDAVEGGAIGYDVITSLPDNSTLLREIPSVQGLEEEFQSTYNYYCTYGDRLNVGPHALLKRSQFHRLMKNMKMLDLHTLRPSDVDVILERRLGKGVTKMDFDAFVFVFVAASARRIPTMPWLMGFYFTVLWKLLPSSERLAQMHSSGGLANGGMIIDTDYWLEREIRVKELRKVLIEPDVMYLFNVVKEQLEENSAYLSKLDEQSWKLFLDDEAVQAGESGAGRSGEPVPMPPSSAMGSAAFMSSPSARMALNMEFHGGLTPTPQESTAADPAADDGEEKAADVGRMLSGLSVNGHKLTRDSPSSYLTTASMGARQQASRSPDSWPVRALIDQHLRKQSKAPSPAGKKQAATKPPAPPSPQVERASSPPTFTDSMKHVMRERDEARKEAEKLRSVIENMEARRKIEERQQYEQEEAHETFMAWQRGGVGPGSPQVAARPLSMDSWQAQLRENEGSFGGNSAHFAAGAAGDSDDDGGKPSLDTEPARHADREASSSYYPYPSVASPRGGEPTSPSRGFASAAYRLYEAADSSQSGRLTTGQLIAALQEQPELAEALGFPEDTKWDFVVGYCYSESGDISLAEFIDKLPVLRGAAQYEAALSEQSKSPMRASVVMSPERKVGSRPYYYSSAASQRTSAERLSQPRSSPAMMTTASTRRHASPSPSPRWSARSAARKHRTATASPYMSPQMSSSTRRKREPDFSYLLPQRSDAEKVIPTKYEIKASVMEDGG